MNRKGILLFHLLVFSLAACRFDNIYEQTTDIPKATWDKNIPVSFIIPVTDTISGLNLIFSLRNNNNYPFQYLHLFVDTYSPDGFKIRDTVSIKLAELNGKWIGRGITGIWQNEVYFKKNIRFPRSGDFKIDVFQALRKDNLEGILDFGLRIEKVMKK